MDFPLILSHYDIILTMAYFFQKYFVNFKFSKIAVFRKKYVSVLF